MFDSEMKRVDTSVVSSVGGVAWGFGFAKGTRCLDLSQAMAFILGIL